MILLLFLIGIVNPFSTTSGIESEVQRLIQMKQDGGAEHSLQSQSSTILNVDYIFNGYNLFISNPLTFSEPIDPGFSGRPIFDASYSKQKMTLDGRYRLPDGISVMNKKGCRIAFDSKIIHNKDQLSKYLSQFVDVDLALEIKEAPWAFTASPEYNIIQNSIEQSTYTWVYSQATCTILSLQMDLTEMPVIHNSFLKALESLPESYQPGAYIDFFRTWGTHYLKQMTMGSRMSLLYSLPPEYIFAKKAEKLSSKFLDEDLEQSASVTSFIVKGLTNIQQLPRNQSSKSFTDLTKISAMTYSIEIGPQPSDSSSKKWMADTELDLMPIKYQLGSIVELLTEGKGKLETITNLNILIKNVQSGLVDYCLMLQAQNKRYGPCTPTNEMMQEQPDRRQICLNFYEGCDYTGTNQYICGNRNLVQDVGMKLPEVTAGSVKFFSDTPVIIGTVLFTGDYNQALVLKSFHNDFFFFEQSEQCNVSFYFINSKQIGFINRELGISSRVKVYITEPKRCLVVFMWNYCPRFAVWYFTAVICDKWDVKDKFEKKGKQECEVAILDIRFPMQIPLRMCLYKDSMLKGQKTCFSSETAEQYYGQSFRSMVIDETEVVIHKAVPSSLVVEFED